MGHRTASTTSQVRLYEVDEAGRRLGEYVKDASQPAGWRPVQEFVYLDNWRIVGLVDYAPGGGSSLMAVLSDPITGTPRQVMDNAGDIRWDWDSKEAFGNQAPDQAPTSGKAVLVFDARFPGQWYDSASGLFHNNWRDYWARAGRYTQADPIGLAGGANPYAYAGGNPVEAIDPLGLKIVYVDEASENAVKFLRQSPVADQIIRQAEEASQTLKIQAVYLSEPHLDSREFHLSRMIIPSVATWNPKMELYCGDEVVVPSYVMLFHEIHHFVQQNNYLFSKYLDTPMTPSEVHRWTNRSEKDAILFETLVARDFKYKGRSAHNLRAYGYRYVDYNLFKTGEEQL